MTIIEFLSLGLVPGRKYNVTLKASYDKEPVTWALFFNGFRFFNGRSRGKEENDIIPVFNEANKNGRMSPKHFSARATWPEHIVSITDADTAGRPVDEPIRILNPQEAESISEAVRNIEANSWRQLMTLLREMGRLFPGRTIQLDYNTAPAAVLYHKHGASPCNITRIHLKAEGSPSFFAVGEFLDEWAGWDEFDPDSWSELLTIVMDAIQHPFIPDDEEEKTFIDEETSWKDIPLKEVEGTEVLKSTGLLDGLAADLWFKELSAEQKKATFERFGYEKEEDILREWETQWDDNQKHILFSAITSKK